ncbi:hypothetical protein Tcan_16466 [Toxocara canis]|uniref:Uncharacterized protein n=1 Tax=Toxocara canis TaxID=6265 RepID=A0A0B2W0D0_TOXCA|nr:hypothetical protein Tcan_16466 [Toxocara canis]
MPSEPLGSLVLPQRPAALSYCDQSAGYLIVSTYQLENEMLRNGGFFVVKDFAVVQTLPMSGGVFRFECLPNGHLIAALTNGYLSVVDLKPASVTDMLVMADCILLSVSTRGDKALTSDDHGCLHILGGGVWAIENTTSGELIVSCMYNGWCLIDGKSFEEVQSNRDLGTHLLYGASFCHTSHIVASCTFNNYKINFDRLYASS